MGTRDSEQPTADIKVVDRRRFTEEGEPRPANEVPQPVSSEPASTPQSSPAASAAATAHTRDLPPMDFATFLLSLSTNALIALGEIPQEDGKRTLDLPIARQTIDIISLLRDKTRGNLTPPENHLIEQILHDLRIRFVSRAG